MVSRQDLSDITTRVFVQLLVVPKDYNRDIDRTQDGELMCLLEQSSFALEKRSIDDQRTLCSGTVVYLHRTVSIILDSFDFDLSSPHRGDARILRKI